LQKFAADVSDVITKHFDYGLTADFANELAEFLYVAGKIRANYLNKQEAPKPHEEK